MKHWFNALIFNFLSLFFITSMSLSDVVKDIKISGNDRIPNETILMFSDLKIGDEIISSDLNTILKNIYDTNFFKEVSVNFVDNIFYIEIDEAPLIQNITIKGIKAKKFETSTKKILNLKPKSSYNEFLLSQDVELIKSQFKMQGFYFPKIEVYTEQLDNNLVNIEYNINLGEKSKISKIKFIGNKIYKDKTLKNIILSEEFKFWKFISNKKYLQEELISIDKRLLKNHYLNKGFYNVNINSSFAKLIDPNKFELIFNIDTGKKYFFNDLAIILPEDFDKKNYQNLNNLLLDLKGTPYSINSIDKILDEIDKITLEEEYKSIKASVNEVADDDKLNITFNIKESKKFFVEKINIFGNNITNESVIRNQLKLDEGDPYSEILTNKSENNLKSLNFFKKVNTEVIDGSDAYSKIINIDIEEKPTGEIQAGAGVGTGGGTFVFGVKENNYMGKGIAIDANASISDTSFKGKFAVSNPNYNNTDKSVFMNIQAIETDQLKKFGYKTNKNGFEYGTSFEYLEDLNIGIANSIFFEKIETNSSASVRQKAQAGNYFDSFLNLNFYMDKRDQKFKPSDGFISRYNLSLPAISETNTLTNTYIYKTYSELLDDNVSSFSILLKNATSLSNDDIKLSERISIPSKNLRGFESGKVGPKDGKDFIGGNYVAAINLQTTLPVVFKNSQNLDAIIFFDAANIWGVDYDASINDGSKIRSSIGIGVDVLTLIGPLNFSLTEVISKADTDVEETFRFNLGTTF